MACIDCFDNCANVYSDKCVKYTGPDVPLFGICTGDSLFEIETILIDQLEVALGGTIDLPNVTIGCTFLSTLLNGQPQTLDNILQVLLDGECSLAASVAALNASVFAPFTFLAPCLTLGVNPTRDQVLQATITKLCALNTQVAAIAADYVKDSELCTKVNACIAAPTQYNSRMVPYVAYPYHGPLSNFDAGGIGLTANGFQKVYICNGQTAGVFLTPDYRGRSPLGANVGIPGGALDASVDPGLPANAGYGISVATKKGTYTDTLTATTIPAHTHGVTDPEHTHTTGFGTDSAANGAFNNFAKLDSSGTLKTSNSSLTNITIQSTGGSQPHNTTHPVMGCNFIIYVP